MLPRLPTRRCALLAPALAIACEAPNPRRPAPRRPTAADVVDAAARPVAADAGADAGAARSSLYLFVVGGSDLVQPGTAVRLRLEREHDGVVDVTREAAFRVQPEAAGRVDPDGTFHALARGRALVVATRGADEARTIVDVTTELPAGLPVNPTVQLSGGYVARSLRFDATPDGYVRLEVHATGLVLSLRGRRSNNTFPIAVPVTEENPGAGRPPDLGADAATPPPIAGTLTLDRWVDRRLEGHAALRVAGRPLQVRFTTLFLDAAPLRQRVAP